MSFLFDLINKIKSLFVKKPVTAITDTAVNPAVSVTEPVSNKPIEVIETPIFESTTVESETMRDDLMPEVKKPTANDYVNALLKECALQGITDPYEQAAMMSQFDHESKGFTRMIENLNYKPERLMEISRTAKKAGKAAVEAACKAGPKAVANLIYGGRHGNIMVDDGWTFRGRGPTMLTFRANYTAAAKAIGVDIVTNPDLVLSPEIGAKVSIWFWKTNVRPKVNDMSDVVAVRKAINGGTIGLEDCKKKYVLYVAKINNLPKGSMLA